MKRRHGPVAERIGVTVNRIFVLGLAYKKNVDDIRKSLSLEIIDKLMDMGADVQYNDPYFDTIPPTRKHQLNLSTTPLNADSLKSADVVLLATDHDNFDYDLIEKEAKLIVDTRGRFNKSDKIVNA